MSEPLISRREAWLWVIGVLVAAALIVATGFGSDDPDSALYAGLAARLADEPVARWVAPEWWGFWPEAELTGLFLEHPAGVLLLPAALGRLGVPPEQAAYAVGAGAGALSLVLLGVLAGRVLPRPDARAVLILVQLIPAAFIFRVRANHEYPMLACLLLALLGLEGVKRSWRWWPALAIGLAGGLLVKGVFLSLILLAVGLWLLCDPTRRDGGARRQWLAVALAAGFTLLVALAWDGLYVRATGQTFWSAYWARQLGPITIASPVEDALGIGSRLVFYLVRLLWHPAPWSLALVWLAFTRPGGWRDLPAIERRTLLLALAFAGLAIAVLVLPSRFAERYAFSATFVVATVGAVAAARTWPALGSFVHRLDQRVTGLPVLLWLALVIGRLVLGPWLPRV
jgi:4-amino-4-deoxy-L-arabinose transferase-like glycosyltransferase